MPRSRWNNTRRVAQGFALLDVIIAGVLLAIGLSTIFAITARSLEFQKDGEVSVQAAAMMDDLLSTVLLEGPLDYPKLHATSGPGEFPYEDFTFQVRIEDPGEGEPFRVTAAVEHSTGRAFECETLIAAKSGEEPDPERMPEIPIDREARYEEILSQ